jgi:hypothetical protein
MPFWRARAPRAAVDLSARSVVVARAPNGGYGRTRFGTRPRSDGSLDLLEVTSVGTVDAQARGQAALTTSGDISLMVSPPRPVLNNHDPRRVVFVGVQRDPEIPLERPRPGDECPWFRLGCGSHEESVRSSMGWSMVFSSKPNTSAALSRNTRRAMSASISPARRSTMSREWGYVPSS